jgi:alcohol dehydrogenase (NADP+)
MKFAKLISGDEMPLLGLGTWKAGKGEVYKTVLDAIEVGYRHFDCAFIYGNEAEIGEAFAHAMAAGEIKREDLWITSKLWNDAHKQEHVLPAINKTLTDLKLDYLDLYLIHWSVVLKNGIGFPSTAEDFVSLDKVPLLETWNAMIELQKSGLARNIGVSNFSSKKIQNLIDNTGVVPAVNQVEMHPILQQNALKKYCDKMNIHLTAYAPLGSADRPATRKNDTDPNLFLDEVLLKVADSKGISIGELLLAWAVNRGTSAIPKTVRKERLIQNLASADIELSKNEMAEIEKVNRDLRFIKGDFWCFPGNSYTLENLWDEQ